MRYLMKLESFIENKTYIKTYEKYYDGDYEYFKNLSDFTFPIEERFSMSQFKQNTSH